MVKTMYHGYNGAFEVKDSMLFFTDRNSAEWFAYAGPFGDPAVCEANITVTNLANEEDLLQAIKEEDVYEEYVTEHDGNAEFISNYLYVPAIVDNLRSKGFDGYEGEEILTNNYYSFIVVFCTTQIEVLNHTPLMFN